MVKSGEYDQSGGQPMENGEQSPRAERLNLSPASREVVPSRPTGSTNLARTSRGLSRPITSITDTGLSSATGLQGVTAERRRKTSTRVRQPWDGSTSERQEDDTREPLVHSITECGDDRSENEKVAIIANASDMLSFLDVAPSLVEDIRRASDELQALGSQVLTREPTLEEREDTEGRGLYYKNVPVGDGDKKRKATVYVKGTGNGKNFNGQEARFSGFPADDNDLFFDDPQIHFPRIKGADYLPTALLELINSSVEFAQLAKKNNWTSIDQAIDAGVTIPLFVTHFKEASEHFRERVEHEREESTNPLVKKALDWGNNFFGIGTVTQIVPSSRRLTKGVMNRAEVEDAHLQVTDAKNYTTVGRAVRQQFESSDAILDPNSAHGQNVYRDGIAVGDLADHLFLHDFTGASLPGRRDKVLRISGEMQQTLLLYKLLTHGEYLSPHYYPIPQTHITAEKINAMQKMFWNEMLSGSVETKAIKEIYELMPFLRTELTLAIASRFVDEHKEKDWSEMSAQRHALLDQYTEYSVREEYDRLRATSMEPAELLALFDVLRRKRLPIEALSDFLELGSLREALEIERDGDMRILDAYMLREVIWNIPDLQKRDEILNRAGQYYGFRDINRLAIRPDQIAAFEGKHADIIAAYIKRERYDEARMFLEVLLMSQKEGFRDAIRATRKDGYMETSEFFYSGLLTVADPTRPEILSALYSQCSYDKALYDFSSAAKLSSLGEKQGSRDESQNGETVLFDAQMAQLPTPETIIRAVFGSDAFGKEKRTPISEWLEKYLPERQLLQWKDTDHQAIEANLANMASEVKETYPELAFGHACFMADRLRTSDPKLAERYRQEALEYYQYHMRDRLRKFGVSDVLRKPSQNEIRRQYGFIARKYQAEDLMVLGTIYNNLARGKMEKFGWPPQQN